MGGREATEGRAAIGGRTIIKKNTGFSLIELIIVISIMTILCGLVFINPSVSKRRKVEQYASELGNQLKLAQTMAMAKAGQWRLCLYLDKDDNYYCVQEQKKSGDSGTTWEAVSEKVKLGHDGAVVYTAKTSEDSSGGTESTGGTDSGTLIREWRFNRDTGACELGAGILEVTGGGTKKNIIVYKVSGRCEVTAP